jgi:hypothetical protein
MTTSVSSIPSVQTMADGQPRFHLPVHGQSSLDLVTAARDAEANGGVQPEIRAFLDAQLETGDVVVDMAPGFGFVALTACTAPGGRPTVLVAGLEGERLWALQDAAVHAGAWVDEVAITPASDLAGAIGGHLGADGRTFVHLDAAQVAPVCERLRPLLISGQLMALCISDAATSASWPDAVRALEAIAFQSYAIVEVAGDPVMVTVTGLPDAAVIALPRAVVGSE